MNKVLVVVAHPDDETLVSLGVKRVRKIKEGVFMVLGFALYMLILLRHGGYRGFRKFYRIAQQDEPSITRTLVLNFLNSPLSVVFNNYRFLKDNINKERLTETIIQQYGDYEVGGYANIGDSLESIIPESQQRELLLPVLSNALREIKRGTVVEIGTANGDMLGRFTRNRTTINFIGVDFNTRKARKRWGFQPNMRFISGYALDMLLAGHLIGDILFASSCFCLFAPKELARYIAAIDKAGFKQIVLNEPTWGGYKSENNEVVVSKHVEHSLWHHNYCGYLRAGGYQIEEFRFFPYHPWASTRPDIFVSLIRAKKEKEA